MQFHLIAFSILSADISESVFSLSGRNENNRAVCIGFLQGNI